jgi:hypothetical protein
VSRHAPIWAKRAAEVRSPPPVRQAKVGDLPSARRGGAAKGFESRKTIC